MICMYCKCLERNHGAGGYCLLPGGQRAITRFKECKHTVAVAAKGRHTEGWGAKCASCGTALPGQRLQGVPA